MWTTCLGRESDSYYAGMSIWNNKIYVLYNTSSSEFGSSTVDMQLSVLDLRTGLELTTKLYGSTVDDTPIDLVVNHFGVFMIGDIGNGFKDQNSADSYQTQNSKLNFAIIFCDYDGNIQEIESYDTTDVSNDISGDYPLRLFITRENKQEPLYMFITYRNDEKYHVKGGVSLTQVANQQGLFVTGSSLAACSSISNCELCSSNICFKCTDGYKVQEGVCKLTCDDYFYHQYDDTVDNSNDIDICLP